jgi:predicted NBD/HSP70 family sugar kinase
MVSHASTVQRVLAHLLEQDRPVTRPEIAAALELSRPTIFTAIERLERDRLLEQVGQLSGKPGRSAALYDVDRTAGLLGAIDIGGSNVRVAVADSRGRLLREDRQATTAGGGGPIVKQVAELLLFTLDAVADHGTLRSVAVSVPGVVGPDDSTVSFATNIDQFAPFDFRAPLAKALGARVTLENNVNLAAMAEQWQGMGRDLRTFAVVSIGAGVGAGIVYEGRILRGAHRAAGEVASVCSTSGRLDNAAHDEAGGLSLLEKAGTRHGWPGRPPASVEELFARAAARVEPASTLVEEECQRIAAVTAAVCAVIDPEAIIMTGGVGSNEHLIERVRVLTTELTMFPPSVVRSTLGDRASLLGAVRLASQALKRELVDSLST